MSAEEIGLVTSKEILEATGLKTARTLVRWHNEGLIPKPVVGLHPSGHGRISWWPQWVLDRCVELVDMRRKGQQLWGVGKTTGPENPWIGSILEDEREIVAIRPLFGEKRDYATGEKGIEKITPYREGNELWFALWVNERIWARVNGRHVQGVRYAVEI